MLKIEYRSSEKIQTTITFYSDVGLSHVKYRDVERLESLESLEIFTGDYRAVKIPDNAVVYCDIPYKGTAEYTAGDFDHAAFYEWALSRPFPVFVSEYAMPSEFVCVWDIKHRSILSGTANNAVTEKLFCNKKDFGRLGQLSFL